MKTRGATVALSAGWVDMWRKRERRAEKRVGGDFGIGAMWTMTGGMSEVDEEMEGLRSGFLRTETKDGGGCGCGCGTAGGGD